MAADIASLAPGDVVEIKYRLWRTDAAGETMVERWIVAQVVAAEPGTWPLARLADGQVTEIRPFMTWRALAGLGRRRSAAAIAA